MRRESKEYPIFPFPIVTMNLVIFLALSVCLPSSILCGTSVLRESKVIPSLPLTEDSNSSHVSSTNVVVKREVSPDYNFLPQPYYAFPAGEMMPKRSAAGLNKFFYVLRNSLDKPQAEMDIGPKDMEVFSGDMTRALGSVERRGQTMPQKDRKIYYRCYFNAVSCFRKKK